MNDGYLFKATDYPLINLQLSIEMMAFQQSFASILLERMNFSEQEKDDIVNELNEMVKEKKETILASLYESFGSTPDVGV